MGTMIAIGGGELNKSETLAIDQYIVQSAGKKEPKALFIPTASYEAQGYIEAFQRVYGEQLGCQTDILYLLDGATTPAEMQSKIMSSDLVYVGGGVTKMMLSVWREHGVDQALKEAYEAGVVLSGLSAGAICWFSEAYGSEMNTEDAQEQQERQCLQGLGLIPAAFCPHYNEEEYRSRFDQWMLSGGEPSIGIGLDNHCALVVRGTEFKVIRSAPHAGAYRLYSDDRGLHKQRLDQEQFADIEELLRIG
ncbi:peptidase E [Paenibacillus campinasensis]|nr:peptidase E [Paenibacillus campinasensis]